jgi:nucleotide-binding universal stress UspA family protein
MSLFASLLVPLDGSSTAAQSLGCATWLASRLHARLHILSATPRELPARGELARLHVPEEHWPLVELHQAPAYPADAILAAIARHDARLVIMTARGAAAEEPAGQPAELPKLIGHVTQAVIERCAVPVLLLPPGYRELLPWQRVLVPVSGGSESDQALALAVRLACALDLAVHVVHVVDADSRTDDELTARARYADEMHHEYPAQLEELVARALPALAPHECRRVRDIVLGHGDVADQLVQLIKRDEVSVLGVGWHGQFAAGRADVLKKLITVLDTPVLLVKCLAPAPFRLKAGEQLA